MTEGGGVEEENIQVVELDMEAARSVIWTRDEECPESRPASMLLALTWFFYQYKGNK